MLAVERFNKAVGQEMDELDLTDYKVGDEDLGALADRVYETARTTTIRKLLLQRCGFGPLGVEELGKLLAAGLGGLSPLEGLVLSGNDIGPTGLQGAFCEGVKLSKSLRSLDLGCCSLTDEGIVPLCEILRLRSPTVTDEPALEVLGLGCNRLGPAAVETLCSCLATNLHLRRLDLKANALGTEGGVALAEGLSLNKGRLKSLDVSQNELRFEGAKALATFFTAREFQVVAKLNRPRGKPSGISLTPEMVVYNVGMKSPTDEWNVQHPRDAICVDDRVVKVNGEEDRTEMMEQLYGEPQLEITLTRTGGLEFLDLCHNMVTLKGVKDLREQLGCPSEGPARGWQLSFEGGARQLWLSAH